MFNYSSRTNEILSSDWKWSTNFAQFFLEFNFLKKLAFLCLFPVFVFYILKLFLQEPKYIKIKTWVFNFGFQFELYQF